jgi:exportin-7
MSVVEGQLTWLTYIVGAIIGGQSWSSAQMEDGEEIIDASLSRRVLQLAQGIDYRLSSTNGLGKADPKLEISLLYYFQFFRRVYMFLCDQVGDFIVYSIICNAKIVIA